MSNAVAMQPPQVHHRTVAIDGVDVFYREAGRPEAPALVLLHGFPTSSHMFRNLVPVLADRYRVVAPDLPGFGNSAMPRRDRFGIDRFWVPIQAYWASGSEKHREALRWLTSLEATRWQYTHGVADPMLVSPDAWTVDQAFLDRRGNQEIQLDLFYDYRTNVRLYPAWQAYFRERRPPMLLDTGHFALETHGPQIARLMRDFLGRVVR